MRGQRLFLRTVQFNEKLVSDYLEETMQTFKENTNGPKNYLNVYKKYGNLLNNKAELEVRAFLKERHGLLALKKVCNHFM